MNQFRTSEDKRPTFEETWPRHEFAPLVAIGLALGDWIANLRDRAQSAPQTQVQTSEVPGRAPSTS